MDLDSQEIKETKKRNGYKKDTLEKQEIANIIRHRMWEITNEEWEIPHESDIKFYCLEELESILFKLLKKED